MSITGLFWERRQPSGVVGVGDFPGANQKALLHAAMSCQAQNVDLISAPAANVSQKNPAPYAFALAIGDGAKQALDWLREVSLYGLLREPSVTPVCDTLILVAPTLPWDEFDTKDKPYAAAALALQSVGRVVVLASGRDTTIPSTGGKPALGREGAKAGHDAKVSVVDVSGLIEHHADAAYGALCSCEAVGLIRRLALGTAVPAALAGRARLLSQTPAILGAA